jgi:hypothetical protein
LSHSLIFYNVIVLAILSKSIAIIDSDASEKIRITDSDGDTSKVLPIVSLSMAITDINNSVTDRSLEGIAQATGKGYRSVAIGRGVVLVWFR